jgi:hypothetical protein
MNNNISDLLYCFTLNSSQKRRSGSDGEVGLWFQTSPQLAPSSPKEGPIQDPLTRCGVNLCFPSNFSPLSSSLKDKVKVHVPDDPLSLLHAVSQPPQAWEAHRYQRSFELLRLEGKCTARHVRRIKSPSYPKITLLHDRSLGKMYNDTPDPQVSIGVSIGGQTSHQPKVEAL